ncbi:hypothetical protein ABTG52_05015, partial [Acinetobacter baumannii]
RVSFINMKYQYTKTIEAMWSGPNHKTEKQSAVHLRHQHKENSGIYEYKRSKTRRVHHQHHFPLTTSRVSLP